MPVGVFVCFETIHAFGNESRVARGQSMYFIIESSTFGQEDTRCKKANWAFFALTYSSHANPFPQTLK